MNRHAQAVTTAPVAQRPVADLTTGPRLRDAIGPLTSLMASLKQRGLIHPLLIRQGHVVVCGHRRLEAARRLGWETIATRNVEELSARELLDLELDENRERRDLSPYERSKRRVAEIQQARQEAKEEAEKARGEPGRNPTGKAPKRPHRKTGQGRGPARAPGSMLDVEERTGMSKPEQAEAVMHVTYADRWPFLQSEQFRPSHILAIRETLVGRVPVEEHGPLMAWAEADEWPPHMFPRGLVLYAELPEARRAHLRGIAETDPRRASAILFTTRALPDPGLTLFANGIDRIRVARREAAWPEAKTALESFLSALGQFQAQWTAHDTAARLAEEETP